MMYLLEFMVLLASVASLLMMLDIARLCEHKGIVPTTIFGVIFSLISLVAIHDAAICICYQILPISHCPALRHDVMVASLQVFGVLIVYWLIKMVSIGSISFEWNLKCS